MVGAMLAATCPRRRVQQRLRFFAVYRVVGRYFHGGSALQFRLSLLSWVMEERTTRRAEISPLRITPRAELFFPGSTSTAMAECTESIVASPPNRPARFSAARALLFASLALAAAAVVSLLADIVQNDLHWAPLFLFPVVVGVILGGALVCIARVTQTGHRPTLFAAAFVAAALAVVGQHFFAFWNHSVDPAAGSGRAKLRAAFPEIAERLAAPAEDWFGFMHDAAQRGRALPGGWRARGGWAWATWAMDGALLILGAMAMVATAARLPFCGRCGTWWRTIRGGRWVGPEASRLVAAIGAEYPPEAVAAVRYRLTSCRGGCGPFGLKLLWRDSAGRDYACDLWLNAAGRDRVMQLADEVVAREQSEAERLSQPAAADSTADSAAENADR